MTTEMPQETPQAHDFNWNRDRKTDPDYPDLSHGDLDIVTCDGVRYFKVHSCRTGKNGYVRFVNTDGLESVFGDVSVVRNNEQKLSK